MILKRTLNLKKYFNMKKLLIIAPLLMIGCKSYQTRCDGYNDEYLIRSDSMIIKVEHCHIEKENYCHYNIDTMYLTTPKK